MSMELMVKAMKIRVGNPLRKLVLIKLADNASDQGECWPSYQHIADQCEISKRSVMNHIAALCESGLVKKVTRKGEKGNSSNIYLLHLDGAGDSLGGSANNSLSGAANSLGSAGVAPGGSAGDSPRTSHSFEPVKEPVNDLKFVEAGELSYPTSGAATAQTLMSSCSALDDCISDSFSGFSIDGVADFVQNDVVGNAGTMLGYVSDAMKVVDSAVSDAARLLQGDISVLLPPPSSGKNFVEQVQKMWRTGKRLYGNASDLVTMIKTLSGVSLGSDLQPRGVWKTDSKTTATATQQRNVVASILRTTAISEAAYAVTRLPAPTTSAVMQNAAVGQATTPAQSTGWPSVTHPALNNAPAVKNTVDLPTWEELTDIRDTLNTAIDKELSRTTSDALFLALRRVKADLNADINTRLEQSARIIQRTPDEVLPALVLAATWFDNAARDADIIRRNAITHPGFVPVIPLKVPVQ